MKALPIITECWIAKDISMPVRNWDRYVEPSCKRNPGYVLHSRLRHGAPKVKVQRLPSLLRRQAS